MNIKQPMDFGVNLLLSKDTHLKRRHIAKFIGFLLVLLAIAVGGIGYITYKNLNEIVRGLEKDSNPNDNLILYKEIMVSISTMENKVESFQLTGNSYYLQEYDRSVENVFDVLDSLKSRNSHDQELLSLNDSMASLINRKTDLLNELLALETKTQQEPNLEPLQNQIDRLSQIKIPDDSSENPSLKASGQVDSTALANAENEQPGFFKRLFKKKEQDPPALAQSETRAIDNLEMNRDSAYAAQTSRYQSELRQTLYEFQLANRQKSKELKQQELRLQNQHTEIQSKIMELINFAESRETIKIKLNTIHARQLARDTNQQIMVFSVLALMMLVVTIIVLFSYVNKNKEYQHLLRQSKEATETLAKSKERFFANMSHEIRTPMNAISGFTKILMKSKLNGDQREQVEIINKSSDHLLKLLNDILDFSKLQAHKLQLENRPFDLKELFDDTCKLLEEPAREKGLKLIKNYQNLPDYVSGDPYRLKQILINLLNNSIKYTDKGSVELKVTSAIKNQKVDITIAVIDTGRGIPKENQHRLFQEFEQSDQSSFSKGTGLGLAITKRLVLLHHGKINLDSTEGKGTTVKVDLSYEMAEAPVVSHTKTEVLENLSGYKVLVADDEPFNVKLLTTLLSKYKAEYDTAKDGQEALDLIRNNPYDIILLDLKMPKLSGWEVAQATREMDGPNQNKLIIALTATVAKIDKEKTANSGFDHIMRKPFDEAELFRFINQAKAEKPKMEAHQNNAVIANLDLSSLERMGDKSFVLDMVDTFILSAGREWQIIEQSYATDDLPALANAAHKIVAPARHLKASKLVQTLKNIEQLAENGSKPPVELLNTAKVELDKIIEQLTHYLEIEKALR